jgi:hypothetical protein
MSVRSRDLPLWPAAVALILLGAALIGLPDVVHLPGAWHNFSTDLGAAVLIAGLLALSVDQWFKRSLLRDAFKELFGYLLPEQLKDELNWIYEQELLCERFDLTLTLSQTDDPELLTARMEQQRELRNVTSRTVSWRPFFAVDEWFHEGRPSQVLSIRSTQGDSTHGDVKVKPSEPFIVARDSTQELSLKPDERVTVAATGEETRHVSDAFFLFPTLATSKPRVTVRAPKEIEYCVMFGGRGRKVPEIAPDVHELMGTLLPGQVIQVRWWPRDKAAAQ